MLALTVENALLTFCPRVVMTAIETAAMSATIMPYSTIVAPSSSLSTRLNVEIIVLILTFREHPLFACAYMTHTQYTGRYY